MEYESQIKKIISDVMNNPELTENLDADTPFQEIGMDSISFVDVIIELEETFGIEISEEYMIMSENCSVKHLCHVVDDLQA